jgi:hypothetical protein
MKLKDLLAQIYEPLGNQWVKQNGIVFDQARVAGLTLAGSIALSVGRKKAVRLPGDIDFVCPTIKEARAFVAALEDFLLKRSVYWKVQTNSRTPFCPKGCPAHVRFTAPFWLPICIMVIGEVRFWRVDGGSKIQQFDDVVTAAKSLDEKDGKGRLEDVVDEEAPPEAVKAPATRPEPWDDAQAILGKEGPHYGPRA